MRPIPEVTDADIAFPARGEELTPLWDEIPKEFKLRFPSGTAENEFFNAAFFGPCRNQKYTPREGVDQTKALRVLKCVMSTRATKHEHKEAGFAFLVREWFENVEWDDNRGHHSTAEAKPY